MTEVNVPLLRKGVEWAEAEWAKPKELCEWYQGQWVVTRPSEYEFLDHEDEIGIDTYSKSTECGTCFCIAGHTIALEDGLQGLLQHSNTGQYSTRAAELLGITDEQATDLFDACNTITDVRRIAEEIAGERL